MDPAAAMYFNNAGFNSNKISYSGDQSLLENKPTHLDTIKLTSTGRSGHNYATHQNVYIITQDQFRQEGKVYYFRDTDGVFKRYSGNIPSDDPGLIIYEADVNTNLSREIPDTKEFSVLLPSIGDTMAKVWDIIYGDKIQNGYGDYQWDETKKAWYKIVEGEQVGEPIIEFPRHTKIEWELGHPKEDPEKLRLIEQRANNGFSFNDNGKVNTIAGAINTMHDLMGMIITDDYPDTQEKIDAADPATIYYKESDGNFQRKMTVDTFTNLREVGKVEGIIADPQPTELTFEKDKYLDNLSTSIFTLFSSNSSQKFTATINGICNFNNCKVRHKFLSKFMPSTILTMTSGFSLFKYSKTIFSSLELVDKEYKPGKSTIVISLSFLRLYDTLSTVTPVQFPTF